MNELTDVDLKHLKRCLELAEEALNAGDKPFGSVLVNENGEVLAEARNRVNEINELSHPEFELANWAADHLNSEQRRKTTLYTSGEHCPMCSTAHAWVGLGNIVYLSSAEQLTEWLNEAGAPESPIHFIPIQKIIKNIEVKGPAEGELLEKIKSLQLRYHTKS